MTPAEMNAWVGAALEHVPKGDYRYQGKFRANLSMTLRNALGPKAEHPDWTVAETVAHVLKELGGTPSYDSALLRLDWPPGRG